jgi:SAM-dependent methyltransferase
MLGAGWNDGYATDQGYTYGFYPQQSPEYLNFACALNGVEPIPLDRPFTYFELGFGQGFTVTLLAASNSHARFYANDFMPLHVVAAEELASSAQLDNLTFLENSFADLAEGKVDLPRFDFITMHGVYSWVSAENRQHIVNFIARYLKPGGVVYTSYNALPGWAPALPMQRLLMAQAESYPGARLEQGRKLVLALADASACYFADNPCLQRKLDSIRNSNPAYLSHEYMNDGWEPRYHADVAIEFSAAKLNYAGSAILCCPFDQLPLNEQKIVDSVEDPIWRETVKDFLANSSFRQDIFVRGARRMTDRRKWELLGKHVIALAVPRNIALTAFDQLTGTEKDAAHAVIDVLAQDARTLKELAQLPMFQNQVERVALLVSLLAHLNYASVFAGAAISKDHQPSHRLNHSLALRSRYEDSHGALASPIVGNGIKLNLAERLVYLQLVEQPNDVDAQSITTYVRRFMKEQSDRNPQHQLQMPASVEIGNIDVTIEEILNQRVPIWRQLKML